MSASLGRTPGTRCCGHPLRSTELGASHKEVERSGEAEGASSPPNIAPNAATVVTYHRHVRHAHTRSHDTVHSKIEQDTTNSTQNLCTDISVDTTTSCEHRRTSAVLSSMSETLQTVNVLSTNWVLYMHGSLCDPWVTAVTNGWSSVHVGACVHHGCSHCKVTGLEVSVAPGCIAVTTGWSSPRN